MKLDDETYGNYEGPITACQNSSITLKDVWDLRIRIRFYLF